MKTKFYSLAKDEVQHLKSVKSGTKYFAQNIDFKGL